jgi:hypothetical protein
MPNRLNVPTWHTHGSYLYSLSQAPHEFHLLFQDDHHWHQDQHALQPPAAPRRVAGHAGSRNLSP